MRRCAQQDAAWRAGGTARTDERVSGRAQRRAINKAPRVDGEAAPTDGHVSGRRATRNAGTVIAHQPRAHASREVTYL